MKAYYGISCSRFCVRARTNHVRSDENVIYHQHESIVRHAVYRDILCILGYVVFYESPFCRQFHVWLFIDIDKVRWTFPRGRISHPNAFFFNVRTDFIAPCHKAELEISIKVQFRRNDVIIVLCINGTEVYQHFLS